MVKNQVFEEVNKNDLPEGTKVIDSTWVCKKKSTGTLQGRLNARSFKQIPGKYYDPFSIASPVTNGMTICIVLTIMLAPGWVASVVDVKGEFIHGEFQDGEEIYMKVPQVWEKHYSTNSILKLLQCIYGLKQAAMAFWC
jgi:hypothetical protein